MLSGVATQQAWLVRSHYDTIADDICLRHSMDDFFSFFFNYYYFCLICLPAPFPSSSSSSSLLPWSWRVAILDLWLCLWLDEQLKASQLFSSWVGGRKVLAAGVRGYCMLHGWSTGSDVVKDFSLFSLEIARLPLSRSFLRLVCLRDWCMMGVGVGHFQGGSFGNKAAVRSVVSFLMLL